MCNTELFFKRIVPLRGECKIVPWLFFKRSVQDEGCVSEHFFGKWWVERVSSCRGDLSVWGENVQGEIWLLGWTEREDGEKGLVWVTHQIWRRVPEMIQVLQTQGRVSLIDMRKAGTGSGWCPMGTVVGDNAHPWWCDPVDKVNQALCWDFNREEMMYLMISLSSYHQPLLKAFWRIPLAPRTETSLELPQNWSRLAVPTYHAPGPPSSPCSFSSIHGPCSPLYLQHQQIGVE